jgi:hypothetical protein
MTSIIGFDAGGPVSCCSFGREREQMFVTYMTCELALDDQYRRKTVLTSCSWPAMTKTGRRKILTDVGQMGLETGFGHGHTLDLGSWVADDDTIQGLAFELYAQVRIETADYALLRLHGLSRSELNAAREEGVGAILHRRRLDGLYPKTRVRPTIPAS